MDKSSVNWPMAIGVSLAIHVVIVGGMFMTSTPQEPEPDGVEAPVPATPVKPPIPENAAKPENPVKPATPEIPKKPEAPVKPEVAADSSKPQVPAVPVKPAKPETALADYDEYTVKSGDNLTAIAKKFNTNFTELAALNQKSVKQLSALRIGQVIKVPKPLENR